MDMTTKDELLDIERRLWTNDPGFYRTTLLPDAVLTFAETGVITRDRAVSAIELERAEGRHWAEVEFTDVRWLAPTPDVVVMTYRVAARWNDQASRMKAMATSVYANRDGGWKLAAHQQTPVQQPGMLVAGSVEGRPVRAGALGALALGACAMGAVALGAVAVGRLAVGSLALGRARVRRLTVGELTIGTLRVRESLVRGATPL